MNNQYQYQRVAKEFKKIQFSEIKTQNFSVNINFIKHFLRIFPKFFFSNKQYLRSQSCQSSLGKKSLESSQLPLHKYDKRKIDYPLKLTFSKYDYTLAI